MSRTLLYFVKDGDDNESLRYSLRSLVNLPHSRVVIVGGAPSWVTGVEVVPGNPFPTKWRNVYANLQIACREVGGAVTVMNDDFFITAPVETIAPHHRGPLDDHIQSLRPKRGAWGRSLMATRHHLQRLGHRHPLSYELHVPVEMDLAMLQTVLDDAAEVDPHPQWRTLYGVRCGIESAQLPDVKVSRADAPIPPGPFTSTSPGAFSRGLVGRQIRELFPDPSPYEEV